MSGTRPFRRPSRHTLLRLLALCALPLVTALVVHRYADARGPFWMGHNQDPSYSYLLGALALAEGEGTSFFHHPGLPTQLVGAVVLRARHARVAGEAPFARHVLHRPEPYLEAWRAVAVLAFSVALVALGMAVSRATGHLGLAIVSQSSALLSGVNASSLSWLSPESTILALQTALAALLIHAASIRRGHRPAVVVAAGLLVGLLLGARYSAIAGAVLVALALPRWRQRFLAGSIAGATFAVQLLTIDNLATLPAWLARLTTRTGSWGSGDPDAGRFLVYLDGLGTLLVRHGATALLATVAFALPATWLWRRHRDSRHDHNRHGYKGEPATDDRHARLLAALGVAMLVQLLLVTKNPASRYLVPTLALIGPALALTLDRLRVHPRMRARPRTASALAVFVCTGFVLAAWPGHRGEHFRLESGVRQSMRVTRQLDQADPTCTVVRHFRSSSKVYALFFGQRLAPWRTGALLDQLYPDQVFYHDWARAYYGYTGRLRDRDIAARPCALIHGKPVPKLRGVRPLLETSRYAVYHTNRPGIFLRQMRPLPRFHDTNGGARSSTRASPESSSD